MKIYLASSLHSDELKKRIDFISITVYNIKVYIIVGVVCPKMIFGRFAMLQ